MAVEIGALRALLSLDSSAFERGARRAEASMSRMQQRFSRVGRQMQSIGRSLSLRVTAPLVGAAALMSRSAMQTATEVQRLAQVANAGTAEFQRFAAGAADVGMEQERVADILKDVNDRVGDFIQTGGGPMADFFENIAPQVGVTADQFARLSGPEALQLFVSSLEAANLSQQDMTFYMEAIASDATLLLPLLRDNGAEMGRLGDRAEELGAIMSEETIVALNNARQSLRDIRNAGAGFSNSIMSSLAPALESLARIAADAASWFSQLSPQVQRFIAIGAALAAVIGPAILALGLFASAIAAISAPIALAVIGVTALAAAAVAIYQNWEGIADWFTGLIERIAEAVASWPSRAMEWGRGLIQGIVDGVMAGVESLRQAIANLWQVIWTEVSAWPGRLVEAGRNLVRGLVDGLTAGQAEAGNAATRLMRGTIGSAEAEAGIQSPSRVFREIGNFIADGLAIGITEGGQRAVAASQNMTNGVVSAAEQASQSINNFGSQFASFLGPVIQGTQSIGDAFRQMGSRIADSLINSGLQTIGSALFGGGGGFLGSLFGGSLPSFDGGGYTGTGARTGGIDGKGGMLSVLHPNETVIDHTRGGRMGGASEVVVRLDVPQGVTVEETVQIAGDVAVRVTQDYDRSRTERERRA